MYAKTNHVCMFSAQKLITLFTIIDRDKRITKNQATCAQPLNNIYCYLIVPISEEMTKQSFTGNDIR